MAALFKKMLSKLRMPKDDVDDKRFDLVATKSEEGICDLVDGPKDEFNLTSSEAAQIMFDSLTEGRDLALSGMGLILAAARPEVSTVGFPRNPSVILDLMPEEEFPKVLKLLDGMIKGKSPVRFVAMPKPGTPGGCRMQCYEVGTSCDNSSLPDGFNVVRMLRAV